MVRSSGSLFDSRFRGTQCRVEKKQCEAPPTSCVHARPAHRGHWRPGTGLPPARRPPEQDAGCSPAALGALAQSAWGTPHCRACLTARTAAATAGAAPAAARRAPASRPPHLRAHPHTRAHTALPRRAPPVRAPAQQVADDILPAGHQQRGQLVVVDHAAAVGGHVRRDGAAAGDPPAGVRRLVLRGGRAGEGGRGVRGAVACVAVRCRASLLFAARARGPAAAAPGGLRS